MPEKVGDFFKPYLVRPSSSVNFQRAAKAEQDKSWVVHFGGSCMWCGLLSNHSRTIEINTPIMLKAFKIIKDEQICTNYKHLQNASFYFKSTEPFSRNQNANKWNHYLSTSHCRLPCWIWAAHVTILTFRPIHKRLYGTSSARPDFRLFFISLFSFDSQ